jgi:hypothetical protein
MPAASKYIHTYTHIQTFAHARARTHTHTHTYVYTHAHAHTYIYMYTVLTPYNAEKLRMWGMKSANRLQLANGIPYPVCVYAYAYILP